MIRRPIDGPEKSTLCIVNVSMLWIFSFGCRWVSLTAGNYQVRHFIEHLWRGAGQDDLIDEVNMSKEESNLLWPWTLGMRCIQIDEPSSTWRVIWNVFWVGKKLFSPCLAISSHFRTPFFGRLYAPCASFLKVTWSVYWIESALFWEPILYVVMQCCCWTGQYTIYCSVYSVWISIRRLKEFHENESFWSQTMMVSISIKTKLKSCLRDKDSFLWSFAKGGEYCFKEVLNANSFSKFLVEDLGLLERQMATYPR